MGLLQEALIKEVTSRSGTDKNIPTRLELAVEARKMAGVGQLGIKETVELAKQIEQKNAEALTRLPDYKILPSDD